MNLRHVQIILRKELTDLFRDRRTLISMLIVPMLIGPAFTAGISWYLGRSRQAAKVERYRIGLTERTIVTGLHDALTQAGFLVQKTDDPRAAAQGKQVDFGVLVSGPAAGPSVQIFSDNSEMKVQMATRRVTDALERLRNAQVKSELDRRQIPAEILTPFSIDPINIAQARKMTGATLGTMLGFVLLIFLFNGAMYSAVDMTAGEKERRTLEMLLSSAATRQEIVLGKVSTSIITAFGTALLSIGSYAVAFALSGTVSSSGLVFPTDAVTLSLISLSIFPIAVLSASIAVAMATPAKSAREAMTYLTPILFVVMFLGMSTMMPEVQANAMVCLVPVANFARMLRQLMLGEWSWMQYLATVAANIVYAAMAILFAVRKFQNERILFRA